MTPNLQIIGYCTYLLLTIPLTIWVAQTLSRNGILFIKDALGGDQELAKAVNQLLLVGFYLLNLGFIALWLKTNDTVTTVQGVFEAVAYKIGAVLLVIGLLHVMNVWVLSLIRRRHQNSQTATKDTTPVPAYGQMR